MSTLLQGSPRASRSRRPARNRLYLELLEARSLPAALSPVPLLPIAEAEPNDTLDQAQELPLAWLSLTDARSEAYGSIGTGAAPTADVDWYRFTLDRAAEVNLAALAPNGNAIISLYNEDFSGADPYNLTCHRLLAQADDTSPGGASLDRPLGQGTYCVAISGTGNRFFHPFLADSGYPGAPGDYQLLLTATDLGLDGPLPVVLPDVGTGPLDRSPFTVRLQLSQPLDPALAFDLNVLLTADGGTGDNLVAFSVAESASELLLFLTVPLSPGSYTLSVAASGLDSQPVLGQDYTGTFQVADTEGAAIDTPASACEMTLTDGDLFQVSGAISDAVSAGMFNPNEVDVYHFQLSDPGRHALTAEAFAGRIGSPLNPALSLYQLVGDQLHLVALNDDTLNLTEAPASTFQPVPLLADPVLYAGLEAGDYYLVVSASGNAPDPFGPDVPFDPSASLAANCSGFGWSWGDYVLNVQVQADDVPPQVLAVTPVFAGPADVQPVEFVVQFSEPVNLRQITYATFQNVLAAVYVTGPGGEQFYPRLVSYDTAADQATFLLLDRLDPGLDYQLHLSGVDPVAPIADLAGNPLAGSDGAPIDSVFDFTFANSGPGLNRTEGPNDEANPQDLGVLSPYDLDDGVTVTGGFTSESADYYELQVLEDRQFILTLNSLPKAGAIPPGAWLTVTDVATNTSMPLLFGGILPDPDSQVNDQGQIAALTFLKAGATYVVRLDNWGKGADYQLRLSNGPANEVPPPLTVGPAPAIRIRLRSLGGSTPGLEAPPGSGPEVLSLPAAPPPAVTTDAAPAVTIATTPAITTAPASDGTPSLQAVPDTSLPPPITPAAPGKVTAQATLAQGTNLGGSMAEGSVVQPVAAADVPKPFFVTAITPAGDGTTDDNPVSAIAPTGTAAGASNIPASVFLGLGSRPLSAVPVPGRGAVLSPPDAFERVFTQAPFVPLPDQFLRLSILTQFLDYVGGDDRESQAAPESSSRGTVPEWGATWLWGPGGLLGAAGTQPATRSHLPERVPGEALSEPDNSDEDPEPVSRPDPVAWFRPQTTPLGEHSVSTGVLAGTCETPTQTTESGRAGLLAWAFLGVAWGGRKPSERGVGQPGRRWWDERVG